MTKTRHNPDPQARPLSTLAFVVRCRLCKQTVSRPIAFLAPNEPVRLKDKQAVMSPEHFVLACEVPDLMRRYNLDHGVLMHADDLLDTSCYTASFGCCGYRGDSPNLTCSKSHLLGTRCDDCVDPAFVHCSLNYCELFPLPRT